MKKRVIIAAMATILVLSGCSSEEKVGDAPLKEKTPISTKIMEKSKQGMEVVSETAEKVQKQAVEKTSKITDTIADKTVELQKTAADMTSSVQKKVEDVVEVTKETASSFKENTEKSIAALVPGTQQSVKPVVENLHAEAAATVPVTAAALATEPTSNAAAVAASTDKVQKAALAVAAPEMVVLENKKGKITMPHKMHAEKYSCTICHGDVKPGPLNLVKDAAHTLCKGCHKETGSGPTTCYSCHAKKPRKPIEGC